ncbi:MAG: diaminopimelate dehydrogenase [Paludibacteraceae bacterium]|nr:diaminopimelate dehydrogenase [Paludibacteraceae bacterium]
MELPLSKIRVAILGYGNIGKSAEEAVQAADDMTLVGIYHHNEMDKIRPQNTDVVLLCTPTREVSAYAVPLLKQGICTVDSFDIHTEIVNLRRQLNAVARESGAVSVLSAGWDPGSDSVVRCLLQAIAPKGITYTNFGPGRSMGHTVAVKAIDGVEDALSMTIPLGTGIHRRMVYVKTCEGADKQAVEARIKADDYFRHDETHVIFVDNIDELNNVAHGVNLVRNGVSGTTHNQRMEFNMSINNPALTGQVMTACARAAFRLKHEQRAGAYTMIEIAPVYLLPDSDENNVRRLV